MSFSSRRRNYMLKRHRRDGMFEFFRGMLNHSFVLDAMSESAANTWGHFEQLIDEHRKQPTGSRLSELVPTIGDFFTHLPLRSAWEEYDAKYCISKRRFVNVSFNEIRHVANLAQVIAYKSKSNNNSTTTTTTTDKSTTEATKSLKRFSGEESGSNIKLITFDGDCTLYSDGASMKNQDLAKALVDLILNGVHVGLVTAAGYGHDAPRYEERVQMLLTMLENHPDVNSKAAARFFVLGGECNFLLHCKYEMDNESNTKRARLHPDTQWMPEELKSCTEESMQELLDVAEASLKWGLDDLGLHKKAAIIRKTRAVGMYQKPNTGPSQLRRESLDECVLRVQSDLRELGSNVPFCAFNGGNDVFIDIGNKRVGVRGLQEFFNFKPEECLHVGDQFLNTGNDFAARSCCPTVWVTSPMETFYVVRRILQDVIIGKNGEQKNE
jgi:IMP and pyridine-specific 5'-nucleotidase